MQIMCGAKHAPWVANLAQFLAVFGTQVVPRMAPGGGCSSKAKYSDLSSCYMADTGGNSYRPQPHRIALRSTAGSINTIGTIDANASNAANNCKIWVKYSPPLHVGWETGMYNPTPYSFCI